MSDLESGGDRLGWKRACPARVGACEDERSGEPRMPALQLERQDAAERETENVWLSSPMASRKEAR